MKHLLKKTLLVATAIIIIIFFASCASDDEPDKLGSWGQINQNVQRDANWSQIVHNSPFKLGEKIKIGEYNTSEGIKPYYEINFGTYPRIDGSTVAVPMAVEFARQHLNMSDDDANAFCMFSTTHYAYVNLIQRLPNAAAMIPSQNATMEEYHPVDLIIATEPSKDELILASEEGVTLIKEPVCYDAFVFIVNKSNPVDSLTVEQIKDIYTGKITNWKEVGGKNVPINAFQREENSGSQTAMENLVMKGTPMMPPEKIKIVAGMGQLIETVGEYKNSLSSIGYTYKYYIDTLYKNENIKILKINGIAPDEENIRSGKYPYTTCYYGVVRKDDTSNVGSDFLNWMLSDEGQKCIRQAGYIPYIK